MSLNVSAAPSRSMRFENITKLAAGLPDNAITSLIQDRHGYIWIGSYTGLFRFDGYKAVNYKHDSNNPHSLYADRINALYEDEQGQIWVGTNDGIARFEPQLNGFKIFSPVADSERVAQHKSIVKIISDGRGAMWILSKDGLQHFNPKTGVFKNLVHDNDRKDSISGDILNDICLDTQQGLWIATESSGVDYLAAGTDTFGHYLLDPGLKSKSNNVRAIYVDRRQNLWIGSGNGIFLWQPGTPWSERRHLDQPPGIDDFTVRTFFEDSASTVWIGTEAGLAYWNKNAQKLIAYEYWSSDPYGLPNGAVTLLQQDRSDTLWVGVWRSGVNRVDLTNQGFQRFYPRPPDIKNDVFNNAVGSIAGDGRGQLWLGSMGNGLLLFDPARNKIISSFKHDAKNPLSLPTDKIASLYQQANGPLWIGTSAGLSWRDPVNGRYSTVHFDSRLTDIIRKITPGRGDVLWLGTEGGLIRYDIKTGVPKYYKHDFADPDSRSVNYTNFLLEDKAGRLWVSGFNGGGLDMLDPATGKFRHFLHDPENISSLLSNDVRGLYEDKQGQLWISTLPGLSKAVVGADGSIKFISYNPQDSSLQASQYGAIIGDDDGKLWITNQTGLAQFNPRTGQANNYFPSDGITDGRFYDGAFYKDNGVLYFGGYRGMTSVLPQHVEVNALPPTIAITDITIFNRPLNQSQQSGGIELIGTEYAPKSLSLSWRQSVFSIEFAALHFADPLSNKYAYKLEGFDESWIETDAAHRIATYTNLNPGRYEFRVKASNNNGVWNEDGISLPIIILPPFWKTWWFYLLSVVVLCALIFLMYRQRVHYLHKQKAALQTEVALRTSELLAANELLMRESNKLKDADRFKSEFISVVSHELRTPLTSIRGSLGLLESGRIAELPNKVLDLIKIAHKNCQRLVNLVNDILDLEKIQSGALNLQIQTVDLIGIARQSIEENAAYADSYGVRYELETSLGEAYVNADVDRLLQVFANLLSNAAKFSPANSLVHIRIQANEHLFRVEIEDHGAGIPLHFRERIFGKFAQADGTNIRQQGGTGLGLNITRTLLEKMHGKISFTSTEGMGTTFWFTLPHTGRA
ncbi:GGDEF domain-containing protein [Undibacterium sp. Jales W-56]|uniref:sensor histidine kinase n=1 Tax=Undibacterium sp. Jales W-56 TaxID=2897325 RepID=UPI0021CE44D0|nr:sensor histidine kinase [Undibacterium sp. Jales W-56]MCU6433810.1 GGDEF domain-containing protein [Undibacterium sp. Jales W-56]